MRQCRSYSEPPRSHPLRPPTNTNETESGAGQSILHCRRKSPQPAPRSHERPKKEKRKRKKMQTGTGQVLDGSGRGLNTARMSHTANTPADRAQANQGVGKVPKPISSSLQETPARKLGKALSRMASWQNRVRDQASHSRKQQTARPHSVH